MDRRNIIAFGVAVEHIVVRNPVTKMSRSQIPFCMFRTGRMDIFWSGMARMDSRILKLYPEIPRGALIKVER